MLQLGGKKHQQAGLRSQVPVVLVQGMTRSDWTAVTNGKTRHQLVRPGWRVHPQHPILSIARSTQIQHRTEVSIGMMMTAHQLIPVADHRPAALQMESDLTPIKTHSIQVELRLIGDLRRQIDKVGMTVQLPDTVDVPGPGTTLMRVARGGTAKREHVLQQTRQFQRIQGQLSRGHGCWKQLVHLEWGHRNRCAEHSLASQVKKKAGPEGPATR